MRPFDDDTSFESFEPEPDYADVALLVASVREFPREEFARELDARVARRFAPAPSSQVRRTARGRLPRWAAGPAVAVVAGAVAAVVVVSGSGGGSQAPLAANSHNGRGVVHGVNSLSSERPAPKHTPLPAPKPAPALAPAAPPPAPGHATAGAGLSLAAGQVARPLAGATTFGAATGVPAPTAGTGGKQIQSAQISLSTPNQHVDQVSQEVFNVVSSEHGTVQNSHITAATRNTGGGYASFTLSVPTGNLQDTMTRLSRLHFANVSSRTDNSQNVSHQYGDDQRHLADDKALRASLLKQLQSAYTTGAIDSIKAQLKLDEQQIANAETTLGTLQHRISYSNVAVSINSGGLPVTPVRHRSSGGFTLSRAVHDAGRVLVVAAGVGLITLAVLLPLGMVAALLMWLWVWLRQRRREHALDAVD